MAKQNMLVWLVVAGIAIYFISTGGFLEGLTGSGDVDTLYPSDLKTTITLNVGDELATSATNVNASYYVFTSDGDYLKEGVTGSDGTADFDVPTAGHYKLLVFNDYGAVADTDYLPEVMTFSTDGDDPTKRAVQTINIKLQKESNATIEAVQDPLDLNANVTASKGTTVAFNLLISAESSDAAINEPVVRLHYNGSIIESVKMGDLAEESCPDRVTTSSEFEDQCFKIGGRIKASDGIQYYSGTLKMDSVHFVSGVSPVDNAVNFTILDTGIYRRADYKTAGFDAFEYSTENPVSNANIGAGDSNNYALFVE